MSGFFTTTTTTATPGPGSSPSLDSAEYSPINHLNLLFSSPASVSSIGRVSTALLSCGDELASEVAHLETTQAYGTDSALERMQCAQAELAQLFSKIETIRSRAIQTEQTITSMTADIKRIDATKRNLTLSMTALKRLQMLTTAYDQLRALAKTRQYRECASLLQAVLQLMRHFNSYRSIEQIATLSRAVSDLQRELLEQVCDDFETAFAKREVGPRRGLLVEACLVMDALGENARARIMTWYINTELREYRHVFRGNDEAGSLDNIGRRYAWFKRTMKTHDEEHAPIFPPHWRGGEMLAAAFCDGTREDFKGILEKSTRRGAEGNGTASGGGNNGLDVNLLLSCLQETLDFEQHLDRRFASNDARASIDTLSSAGAGSEEKSQPFNGAISVAFEPYLGLWVESRDRQLAAMMPRYRSEPVIAADDDFTPSAVAQSAIELFHYYKLTLSQCARLSTGQRLLDLSRTLAKYLDEYAQQVLLYLIQAQAQAGPGASVSVQERRLQNLIVVLNTADFWHTNTSQLEENIRKRIDPELAARLDLSPQADGFLGVASAAIGALVRYAEHGWDGIWREMKNCNWRGMESVGDQSSYVGELIRHVNDRAGEVLRAVAKPQYARAFCDNLVEHISAAYLYNLVQCRPVSEVGAEQMLLDKYVLTKSFENMLSYHGNHPQPAGGGAAAYVAPAGFVKRVNQSMSRVDPLLKTLQVRPSPPEGLVQAYLIHIGDRSEANFRKILDLKGVRKADHAHLVELFVIHRDGPSDSGRKLVHNSPLLTPLMAPGSSSSTGAGGGSSSSGSNIISSSGLMIGGGPMSGGGALAALGGGGGGSVAASAAAGAARFDAALLGERLLSAAREMGDKAAVGAVGAADKATINENLKNIGKFFRSDFGGLGVRFGKRDVSGGGPPGDQAGYQ